MNLTKRLKSILLIGMLIITIQTSYSQNIKSVMVEYSQKMVVDESKIAHFPESIKQVVRAKSKWKPALLIQNEMGSYYKIDDQSLNKTVEKRGNITTTTKSGNKIYFNNFEKGKTYTQISMHKETVLIEENNNKYNWKLESEIKTIDNLECHKATTINSQGKKITAWYTDKFGINNGPKDYFGLPGLVIYLEGGLYTFKMTKVKFLDEKVKLIKPNNYAKKVSRKEYNNLYLNNNGSERKEGNRKTVRKIISN